ncbi:SDR family NAD(P)-dependent oxidoreductase [Achromobacter aegrifaciens]
MKYADLQGKTAIITGGTRGIGYAIAESLLKEGAKVYVTGRSEAHGQEGLERLRTVSHDVNFLQADSTDYESIKGALEQAARPTGGIDLLVSAGAQGPIGPKPFAELSGSQIHEVFTPRFYGRIYPVHAAIPHLRVRGGSVVMIGTDAARTATPGESLVGSVGAAVILMTKTLAREFTRWKIRVNAVAITLTSDTPSWDRIFGHEAFESKLFTKALSRFPSGRAPTAAEVANAAVFLLSGDAEQINGQTVSVNGGLSFGGW